jgi:hypothetical protein
VKRFADFVLTIGWLVWIAAKDEARFAGEACGIWPHAAWRANVVPA